MIKYNCKNKTKKSLPYRSKGERLDWVSIKDAKSVSLSSVLHNGKVVSPSSMNKKSPILVP